MGCENKVLSFLFFIFSVTETTGVEIAETQKCLELIFLIIL